MTPWVGDAAPFTVSGCYVRDHWGRQYITHSDIGLCCCVGCRNLRTDDPIGSLDAVGWDGVGLGRCSTCHRRAADDELYDATPAGPLSTHAQAARLYLTGQHRSLVEFTDVNRSMQRGYRWA